METHCPWSEAEHAFVRRGIHYLAAGRFLALSQGFPVCGNLLHHAVEMLLKGALCRTLSQQELIGLHHNLKRGWKQFKLTFPDPCLNLLDATIASLNKFEKIRYPDEVNSGMFGQFVIDGIDCITAGNRSTDCLPKYSLVLEEVDRLVQRIFVVGHVPPAAYLPNPSDAIATMIADRNRHPLVSAQA